MKTIVLTEDLAGRAVVVSAGDEVRVTLKENGTTGYRWKVGTECTAVLHPEGERVVSATSKVPGAGGEREWVYRAVQDGGCELRFVLGRSWEKVGTGRVVLFPIKVGGG